jgi:hypothetical protein
VMHGQYQLYWYIFDRFWAWVRLRGRWLGRLEGLFYARAGSRRSFSAAIYVRCCSGCLCECVLPCVVKKIIYIKLSIILWYSCITLCITEIWVNWWNVSSFYTSFLWISLHGNQGCFICLPCGMARHYLGSLVSCLGQGVGMVALHGTARLSYHAW